MFFDKLKLPPIHWPEKRPFALGLSHDVDRIKKRLHFLYHVSRSVFKADFKSVNDHFKSLNACIQGDDPYWNFERIMQIEQQLGVRSTFFFLHETAKPRWYNADSWLTFLGRYSLEDTKVKNIIHKLANSGWEIGLHGSYWSYRNRSLLLSEKQLLEKILGNCITGVRQHYLNLDIPTTWLYHSDVALEYDSSFGSSTQLGNPFKINKPFYPYHPATGEKLTILQIPLTIMDITIMRCEKPKEKAIQLINEIENDGGLITLNWHNQVFNPWEYKQWQDTYVYIIEECQRRGAWISRLRDIAQWWMKNQEFMA